MTARLSLVHREVPMALAAPLLSTSFPELTPTRRGKVRDLYEADGDLLIVATDRISAFDYVLGSGIPDKGKVLTQLSTFWFNLTANVVPNLSLIHISEPTRLGMISYAVFCLKKK